VLDDIIHDAASCLKEVRHLLADLRNQQAGESELAAAIARTAAQVCGDQMDRLRLDLDPAPPALPGHTRYNLTQIVHEAVANAVHHSGAARITVMLRVNSGRLLVSVADNGCGFNPAAGFDGHYGLAGMKERAAEVCARLEIASRPGAGASVTVALPVSRPGR
jgi:signal transduction histidine kinase